MFTDLKLLVGPDKVPVKVHRVILAEHLEYFSSMFSADLKESTSTEVRLPFLTVAELNMVRKYVYNGEANLTKENVFKMALLANYFGIVDLLSICCSFIKRFTNSENCVKLLEVADQLNIIQLRENCFLFIVDHLSKINIDDLSALPVDVLLEIIKHPAAVLHHGGKGSTRCRVDDTDDDSDSDDGGDDEYQFSGNCSYCTDSEKELFRFSLGSGTIPFKTEKGDIHTIDSEGNTSSCF